MSIHARLTVLAGAAVLAACVATVPLGEPDIREEDVLAKATDLRSTATKRDHVRAALGVPLLADELSGAEVFRITGKQRQMALYFVPYPIPMPMPSEKQEGYTLVTYDDLGQVVGVDAGLAKSNEFGPTGNLVLRTGDYEFLHSKHDRLVVDPQRYLRDRVPRTDATACTLLVGCSQGCDDVPPGDAACGVCWTRLQVDDGAVQDLPLIDWIMWSVGPADEDSRSTRESACRDMGGKILYESCTLWRRYLVPLRLAPGRHALRATSPTLRGEVSGQFDCEPGEFVFAMLAGEVTESYSLSRQLKERFKTGAASGSISFSRELPLQLEEQRVIVSP